jgi:hypothetical protein
VARAIAAVTCGETLLPDDWIDFLPEADAALAVVDTGLAEKVTALANAYASQEPQATLWRAAVVDDLRALVREHEQAKTP